MSAGVAAMGGVGIMVKVVESEGLEWRRLANQQAGRAGADLARLRSRLGCRALVAEQTIEDAKIRAIRERTSVSAVVEELLEGWLSGDCRLKVRE